MNPLEWGANATTAVSIALAALNSVHTWWMGIVGGLLFAALCHGQRRYADVLLQVFFVATGAVGWWYWRGGRSTPAPVRHAPRGRLPWLPVGAAAVMLGYGAMLRHFTDAAAPCVRKN